MGAEEGSQSTGTRGSSTSRDSSPTTTTTGQSQKHMFLHLSPFRAIAPSGELLLGPSRSSATTASAPSAAASLPSSLLASSCSGPSRQDERTTARLIPSPGIGYDLPVSGRVVLPRALRFPPKVKRCQKDTNIEKKLFLRWFSPGHSGFHIGHEKISKKRHCHFEY